MNYLYGKLNKELEYVKYSGEDTDTVNITVDNTDNIIKADIVRTPKTLTIHNNIYDSYDSFNGSHEVEVEVPKYTLELQESSDEYLSTYDFKLNDKTLTTIKMLQQVTQNQLGFYKYTDVEANFEETNERQDYKYSADIKLKDLISDTQIPNIYFSKDQVDSANYAPYCETYYKENNYVLKAYSKQPGTVIIPLITLQ